MCSLYINLKGCKCPINCQTKKDQGDILIRAKSFLLSVSDIIQMLAMSLIKSAATEWDQEHFTQFPKPWLFKEDICYLCFARKTFLLRCSAEGYVRIILVYRCFHCNNPELIVWKLHQSRARARAPEPGVNSKYTKVQMFIF